jgi:hypothetical protein
MEEKTQFILNQTGRKMLSNLYNKKRMSQKYVQEIVVFRTTRKKNQCTHINILLHFIRVFHKGWKITEFEIQNVTSKMY